MSHDRLKLNKEITQPSNQAQAPNTDRFSQLDTLYHSLAKEKLDKFKKTQLTGLATALNSNQVACSTEMTSQYEVIDITIDPTFLTSTLQKAKVETAQLSVEEMIQICVALGEALKSAFNETKNKAQAESEQLVNNLLRSLPDQAQAKSFNLNERFTSSIKTEFEAFRNKEFVATFNTKEQEEQGSPLCSVKMTSRYIALELVISSHFLLRLLNETQVNTQALAMDQLAQVCMTLALSVNAAFNNAVQQVNALSEQVFNEIQEAMRARLSNIDN